MPKMVLLQCSMDPNLFGSKCQIWSPFTAYVHTGVLYDMRLDVNPICHDLRTNTVIYRNHTQKSLNKSPYLVIILFVIVIITIAVTVTINPTPTHYPS